MSMAISFATSLSKWHWFKTPLSRLRFESDGDASGLFDIQLAFRADIPIRDNTSVYLLWLWPLLLTWFNFNPSMDK